jgi:hypothetical protein
MEAPFEDDELQGGDPATSVTTRLQDLDLGSQLGGSDRVTRAYVQISRFNMKEMERDEGKVALEDYLQVALTMNNTVRMHWEGTEED